MCRIILPMILISYIATVVTMPIDNFPRVGNKTKQLDFYGAFDEEPKVKVLKRNKDARRISAEKCDEYTRNTVWILPLKKSSRPVPISIGCTFTTNPLISGGEVARPGEFPHMVAVGWLLENGNIGYYCGGSLLSERWVLSAAHCTHHVAMGNPSVVRVGANRLSSSAGELVAIEEIKRHPSYRPPSMYADLALLKLVRTVSFRANVRPACLDSQFNKAPTHAWVTGWGSRELDGESSDVLLKAKLEIVDNVHCSLLHNFTTSVPSGVVPSMLCAGDPDGGWKKDTCQGDSGGPLQAIHPEGCRHYSLIGVTSFGRLCATPDLPGVYTRVSHYLEWIESNVWPEY